MKRNISIHKEKRKRLIQKCTNIMKSYDFKKNNNSNLLIFLLCIILSIIGITICSTSSPLYFTNMGYDSNIYFTVGKSVLNGKILYKDLFDQKGPVLYFLYTIGSLISYRSFFGVYLIEILCFSFYLYYSAKTIKLFLPLKYIYLILPIITMLMLTTDTFTFGGIPEELILPFLSYSMYNLLKSVKENRLLSSKELFVNGFLCGIIFMIKFNLIGFYFTFMIFVLLKDFLSKKYKKIFVDSFIFLLAMIIPFLLCSIYFILNHAFKDFIDGYFAFNLFHYGVDIKVDLISGLMLHLKRSITLCSTCGILMYVGLIHFAFNNNTFKKENKLLMPLLFAGMFIFIFINLKAYTYYYYPLYFFSLFGIIAIMDIIENYYKSNIFIIMMLLVCILFIPVLWKSPNVQYLVIGKYSHPSAIFAKQINKNSTILHYDTLDTGVYNILGTVPNMKYYFKPNISDNQFDKIQKEHDKIIKNKQVDYVIYKYNKKEEKKDGNISNIEKIEKTYKLINTQQLFLEKQVYIYNLYKKK